MALFDENVAVVPVRRRRMPRTAARGLWALTVALAALLVLTVLPTSYVIERPGPVHDTLGEATAADGEEVPLISIEGAQTYPTAGSLDLLTVEVVGNRERTPSWYELALAWFDPSRAVVPIDDVFPSGQSTDEHNQQSAALMVDSQKEATAAALDELGYDVTRLVRVHALTDDSPARGVLEPDDVIVAADGTAVTDTETLRAAIAAGDGAPVTLDIVRGGAASTVSVTPVEAQIDGELRWAIGVTIMQDFDFPIQVTIQLDDVGGPSAGMMFALGIIDKLTPGELNDGREVAGTGTIDADGQVGPIGGIRQKLYGARGAGADYFLAPQSNCDEVVGHIPEGLRVFSVDTLDDALTVLTALRDGGDLDALPTCVAG
ncbi:PDZ domain-containing protein [Microbacterium sp.]|uniref:YlbL family protein n=1 Tax=Microbacterium sp. TaxID=51671 RepID=UPI0039E2C8C7